MRSIIFLLLTFFITIPAWAQTPNKQQMQGQMKEVVNELNKKIAELEKQITEARLKEENAESISQKEEQLAMLKKQVTMMGGLNKGISNIPDKAIQQSAAQDDNNESVPKKDSKRISMLPDRILTNAELVVFVKKITTEVEKKISPFQKAQAEIIYTKAKENKQSNKSISGLASLCWMNHYTEIALYLAGKACTDDMTNPDNLNNYAAFLTMTSGEHLAIPILQNLNRKYPGNSTVTNNLGQAWYGLGDMSNANKFLDSTIKIYPGHSLAHVTKAAIQKSEGKTQESIESLKRAIKENYTPEKEAELVKLGGSLKYDDIPFKYPAKAEPLGIEKFILTIPAYPVEGGLKGVRQYSEWEGFREKLGDATTKIDNEKIELEKKVKAYIMRLPTESYKLLMPYNTPQFKTAKRKMDLLFEWATDHSIRLGKEKKEAEDLVAKWRKEYDNAIDALSAKAVASGIFTGCTQEVINLATAFNIKANTVWQDFNTKLLSFQKQFINQQSRLSLYAFPDRSLYELTVATIKTGFLGTLYNLGCEFEVGCLESEKKEEPYKNILPDFDEMNCQYKTELSIPCYEKVFSIKIECNKMFTKFDLPFIKGEIQENLNTNKLIDVVNGSFEIAAGFGLGGTQLGPLDASMGAEIGAFIEFDNTGVKDFGITGSLTAGVSTDHFDERAKEIIIYSGPVGEMTEAKYKAPWVKDQSLEIGMSARSGWNSGTTVSGTGLLSGIGLNLK